MVVVVDGDVAVAVPSRRRLVEINDNAKWTGKARKDRLLIQVLVLVYGTELDPLLSDLFYLPYSQRPVQTISIDAKRAATAELRCHKDAVYVCMCVCVCVCVCSCACECVLYCINFVSFRFDLWVSFTMQNHTVKCRTVLYCDL
jgi:hypothetical protein